MTNMFDENGNYNKTEWKSGDRITAGKLNKIEESLEAINNNDIERHKEADERLDALEEQKEAVEERFDELEDLVADNKSEVDTAIYEVHSKMDRLEQEMNDGIEEVHNVAETVDDRADEVHEVAEEMEGLLNETKAFVTNAKTEIGTATTNAKTEIGTATENGLTELEDLIKVFDMEEVYKKVDGSLDDMEAMVAEVEADLEGLHAKDDELSEQLTHKASKSTSYEMINIKEFGAKGDGNTNDSSVFNEALAKTNHLYIPKGTYNVKGLRCYHPITIEGEKGTVLHCFNDVEDYSGLITFFEVEGDINIKNITTTGLQARANTVIKFHRCKSDILIQDVSIKDTFNEGIVLDGYNILRVDNCLFQNTDVCIMVGTAAPDCENGNIFISNSRFEQSTSECISTNFEGKISGDVIITNCRFGAGTTGGAMLAIMGGNDVVVSNCIFDANGRKAAFIGKNGGYTDYTTYRLNNCVIKNIHNANIIGTNSTIYINNSHIYNCHAMSTNTSSRLVLTNSEVYLSDVFSIKGENSIIDNCIVSASEVNVFYKGTTIRNSTLSNLMLYNDGSDIVFINNIVNGVKSYLNKNPFSIIETNLTTEVVSNILKPNMLFKNYTISSDSSINSLDLQNLGGVYRIQEYNLINTSNHDVIVTFEGGQQTTLPTNKVMSVKWVNFSCSLAVM